MKIIFLGSPTFALPALKALDEAEDIDISLVISQPDRPRSRGKVTPTPVKQYALDRGLDVISPESINKKYIIDRIKGLEPDFLVVIAFGQIIGTRILEAFKDRIINIHGSILPEYRGAAPIQRALYDGKMETGLSAMLIEKEMDAGDVLKIIICKIDEDEDLQSLTDKLSIMSARLIMDVLRNYEQYYKNREKQDPTKVTFAEKMCPGDGYLNFELPLFLLKRQINTCKDRPGAFFQIEGIRYKLKEAAYIKEGDKKEKIFKEDKSLNKKAGYIVSANAEGIKVKLVDGFILLKKIQAPNKRAMDVKDYLNGNKIPDSIYLDNIWEDE